MSIEENKHIVRKFLAKFAERDIEGLIDMLTDDVVWWISGKPELLPQAGNKNKAQISAVFRGLGSKIPGGMEMRLKSLISEGDTVAAEVESYGEVDNGRIYNNDYHFLFKIRDGKIALAKEYMDSLHLKTVFAA